jgi:hypothetical protein
VCESDQGVERVPVHRPLELWAAAETTAHRHPEFRGRDRISAL